ncbi:glutamate cyclase domain-containing protein [Variovorax sp. OV700]|uniref:glutamate cyclase domain-containing protein n=1 Tax=Variovorax sp. OV700 TaxID=1882826 RepID=UPI0008817F70|nr:glutamate cyclase domain-containing protein [Variovorax sp. OV700]SDI82737.1 glutamate racemase [Variovorax sp. OV700]
MLIADGGGSVRVPVNVPNPVNTAQQPASSAESDAAARARELQRQLEALLEKLREAQRQAEEARKRAIEAQKKAQQAREHAEAMAEKAQKTKDLAEANKAKKAQQDAKLEDARAKDASADANLKDKNAALLKAEVKQKREETKSSDAKASAATDKKVQDAKTERNDAQKTSDFSKLYLDSQEKESKAQDAEAKVVELTPTPGRPSATITDKERTALDKAEEKAKTLRGEADAATKKFGSEIGEEANTEFWGDPPAPAGTEGPVAPATDDPLQTPLTQLLQVSPKATANPAANNGLLFTPTLTSGSTGTTSSSLLVPSSTFSSGTGTNAMSPFNTFLKAPEPVVTPQVKKTLTDIADGKSVEQIASDRKMRVDQVMSEANAAGVKITTAAPKDGVQATTIQRGDASLTYSRDAKHDTLSVKGSLADPKAPCGQKTVDAKEEGNGRYSQTTKDAKTGDTVTTTIDGSAGTRTVSVVDEHGLRTDTTTSLTGAEVTRPVGDYEGYLEVAKAADLKPEQLLALNPDVDYGKALKPGQELVVAGVPTTVKTFNKDGSTLEKTTASDGTLQVVATSASGRRTVLMGEPDAKDGPGEGVRKSIFDDKKSVAETAKAMGMTEDEVLAALPEGTVDVSKPSADNGHIETRTIYDPATNRLVVERNDWNHGGGSREDIDDKTKYTVTQKDPKTGKSERVEVSGGLGYLQHQAEDKAKYADSYGQQIGDLDKTIHLYKRMGEPVTDLVEQRKQLVSQQTDARGEATIANTRATAALTKQQQVTIDEQARVAYQNVAYARPGSKDQAEAIKALDDRLELLDHVDRLVDVADKDVDLAKAGADQVKKQDAKTQADADLETEFQKWKRTWLWNGLDEKEIQKREAQGASPVGPAYRNDEEENKAAWKAFVQQQEMMDEHGDKYLTDAGRPARDAWLNRNQASDAALDSAIHYDQASIASGGANTHLTKGELDRLQQKKDAWTDANPTVMPEKFKDQEALDKLAKNLADGEIGNLEIGEHKKHSEYLKTVSAPDRADPEALKKAEDKYTEDNQEATTRLNGQIKDISERPLREKTRSVDDYIAQWGKRNPEIQKDLDALGTDQDQRSLRATEYRSGQIHKLLSASDQGKELQAAINLRYSLTDQWLKIGDKDDGRLEKDLEGIEKGIEGHTWVRDVWGSMAGDSAEDAKNYTEEQRDDLRDLRDDLRAGRISASEYARRENEFMDAYDVESDKMADRVRDSDGTWSVVDDAVRMTVTAAAGIAATIASGGNVAVGFGAAMAVSALWDTTGDVVAAAQGRDIYADGHSSLWTLEAKALTGNASWDDVKFTLKDEVVDAATNAVTATGVGAGIKTSASVSAKLLANGTMVGSKGTLNLAGRAVVGARAGVTSQAIDGTGRVAVEIGRVGLDGKLGTEEGDKRIGATFVSSAAGLVTAPLTGGVSGAIPLWKAVTPAAQAQAQASGMPVKQQLTYFGLGAQFLNDGAAGLGTGDLISLANEGRHMNRGEFIAASLQVIPGTLNNVALHPAMAARARAQAEAAQNAAPARTLHDELVVTELTLPHLANEDSLLPAQVSDAMAPGGRVELHVAADRPDGPAPRNGEALDIDSDQAAAIHERLRSAGFEQIRIERKSDAEAGEPGFIVHAIKEGGEIQTDGVVPLLSRTVPTEPEGQDTSNTADAPDGSNGPDGPNNNDGSDYALPPSGSSLHTVSWNGTLKAILQSGGTLRNTAFYLHATPYDENTGMALNAADSGLPRAVDGETPAQRRAAYAGADSPEALAALPPARYATLKEAMNAAQAGNGDRGHDNIALVYEPKLGADGRVPPEAVLATVHLDKTGDGPATLRDVTQNPRSDIAATVALRVSYPVVQAATRSSGLILPGSAARDSFLHVPDDATVYYVDKSKRVTQIPANDPRVAQALERAQQARARLLALPSHEQGLDLDSLQAWREQSGMKPVDLRVVGPGQLPEGQGIYHRRDGVALVLRDPAIESRHGTAPTLRTAAHELAHGNEDQRNVFVLRDHQDTNTLRPTYVIEPMSGFLRFDPAQKRTTGLALEEAYAEHKAQQFDEALFGPKSGDESFDGQLGRYRLEDGKSLDHGAYTAVTLDAMLRMNPEIGALMERARFSSAAREQLISVLGEKLDAFYAHRGEDLSTRSHQDWAEQLYDAVRHNRPMPAAAGEGPAPEGPVTLNSRPVQRAASAGDDGLPLKPSAFGTDGDWMAAALHLEETIAQQREAGQAGELPPGMILSDADKAVTQGLLKNPTPESQECFVVSVRPPSKGIFGGDDVRAKRKDVFETIEKAQEAVSKRNDGAWIYRVAPEGGIGEMIRVGKARSHNILGAFYVNKDKSVFPVGIANPQFDRWDLSATAPAGRAHVYNAALTMPVGRPAEGIFRQGGIEEGTDAATAAIDRAVAEGRAPRVMIAAGYTIENGRAETSGPGGAAVAGKAARLYAGQMHGVDAQVTYVAAGRRQRKVLQAALEALGERKGEHYEIVSFNARGKRAEWRSAILLRRHQPDLLMGFDVPGRTEKGEYHNSHGHAIGYHTAARDQLFIDATRNDRITTVAGFDLGNEVGGGHPDVHTRVQPAPNGTLIASIVTADVAMTGGRTNWVGYAFGTEVLRRAGALSAVPDERTIRGMVMGMMKAGGVDSETRSRVPFEVDSRGRTSGVGGMSPDVEAAVAAMLRIRAEKIHMAPAIDLRGVRLRLGVFDSGSGGIIAAAEIKRVVEETTGARVDLVMVGDHGAGTYGPKTKTEIADHTRAGLETLDKLGVDLIVMACNTACTSGKGEYARGINAPVIDLIDSTRSFHKGLVDQGERVVAFSTEASATLPLPGTDLIGVYRDKDVLPVGGTDDGFDVASIVNQYMADPMNADMRARMQGAADHYADKILAAKPDVTTVSWCCTHYPELEPFFTKSLQDRGRSDVKMINPMAHQAMRAIEVAEHLPPGTGTGPSRAIGITTAVADKAEAIRTGTDPGKATVQQSEVLQTLRIALQRDDVALVPLKKLGTDVDVEEAQRLLDQDEAGDPIDALQAFDPSGRGFPIHVPGGAYAAAKMLGDAGKVAVVAGFPIRTAAGRVAPESDSTKGAAVLAAGLAKLGKDTTCITIPANVKPLKAALAVLGRDDIDVRAFGLKIGPHAEGEALRMLQGLDPNAIISVEAPGRDAKGQYWSSTGERVTDHVAALDEFFYAARTINEGRADGAAKIRQLAILDVGNEVGGGNVDKRVRRAPDGQRIASEVTVDQLVTAGVGSWGADATLAALEVHHNRADLLPSADEVRRVMRAITREGGVDSQSRTGIDHAAGYDPTVHVGVAELYRQAALEVKADGGPDAGGVAPPKGGTPKPGGPRPAEPQSAAFRGDEWPAVHARLTSGGFGNENIYVYRVKGQPDLYAEPVATTDLTAQQINGTGRVAQGTSTVRWYGNSTPGRGVGGLMPRREMGAKFGLEPKGDKETVYRIKNRETADITFQTEKPTAEQRADPNLLIRSRKVRPPREATPQPVDDWFIVSNQSPTRTNAANGLRNVARGNDEFKLGVVEKTHGPATGWSTGKVIKRQITLGLVAAVGISGLNLVSPIDTGHDVPSGVVGLPRNPIASSTQHGHDTPSFRATPEAFSVPAEVTLGMAWHQQGQADLLARQPGTDPASVKALQDTADSRWGAFSAEMLKTIRTDVQQGANPVAAANRQRAQLLSMGRLDGHSDNAVRDALRDSGLLKGTTADVEAQMDYAKLVADHPVFINDKSRELARTDPAAFAAASLIAIGPDGAAFNTAVKNNAAMLGRLHSEAVVKERLADGDVAGAAKEARLRLDVSATPAERDKAAAALLPLFKQEHARALDLLAGMQMQDVGDYLAQYRDAPPEIAQPMAQGMLELLQKNLPRPSDDLSSMSQFDHLVEGLSIMAEAADARTPTSAFSERFAAELMKGRFADRPEFVVTLQRGVERAVEQGGAKLPVELANALEKQGRGDMRDSVLAGIDNGLQAQNKHLGEAIGNLRGTAGYNATGASMAFYVANFSDGTPQGVANAIAQYRRVNPEVAGKVDDATRVIGDWGRTLHQTQESLNGLRVGAKGSEAERGLEGTVVKVYDSDDVKLAISQSPQVRQELLSRSTQGVPDPRTMTEYLINPVMFVTRHVSGTTRMVWSMLADAQFNGMVNDPTSYATRWNAFKLKTERMANVLGLNADEVRQGTALVDKYMDAVTKVDSGLSDPARINAYARLGGELDGELQKLLGVGAKTVNNVTNANTAFGQALRWVANAGFVTHNVSTEITNLRPMADGVQDYTQWYHRIYAPTQAFFMAKPYTTLMAERSLAGNRVIDGAAADIEGKMAWKYVFGLGTAGVGAADLSLAFGQKDTVPAWVTYTNVGMGVGGLVDGGVGLVNVTGKALARAGAVELGALLAIPAEVATIGGLAVAVFTGIKQFYNVAHHYDQVDAREMQRDPALRNVLKDRGFSDAQTRAMLDCTHEGVSPMVAWNALMKSEGKTVDEGMQLLRDRLAKDGPQGIPASEWTRVMHGLTDRKMNDNDGSFPADDPNSAQAGQIVVREMPTRGGTVTSKSTVLPQSIEGLENYAREAWNLRV